MVRIPIRYQFMFPLFAVAIASLLAVGIVSSRLAAQQTRTRIENQLREVVSVLSESSYPLTDAVLRQMGSLANAQFVLTNAAGNPLASGTTINLGQLASNPSMAKTVQDVALGQEIVVDTQRYLHSSVWVKQRPHATEPSVLHILFACLLKTILTPHGGPLFCRRY